MVDVKSVQDLTLGQLLRQTALQFPDRDGVIFPEANVRLSWQQFDHEVDRAAA